MVQIQTLEAESLASRIPRPVRDCLQENAEQRSGRYEFELT